MGKALIITEKPSVARDFARVLKVSGRQEGYIENDSYVISWCVGHLVGMVYPESYDEKYKKWRLEDLPFLPNEYKYEVIGKGELFRFVHFVSKTDKVCRSVPIKILYRHFLKPITPNLCKKRYTGDFAISRQSRSPLSRAWISASAVAIFVAKGMLCTSQRRSKFISLGSCGFGCRGSLKKISRSISLQEILALIC